jgi:hypothetical protein
MSKIKFGDRTINLPASRLARMTIGVLLIVGGFLGFLPVLGFWMIPLGLMILSVDVPSVRRWRRRTTVKFGNWLKRKNPTLAKKLGFNGNNNK